MLIISDEDFNAEFNLDWRPVVHDGKKVAIWDYPRTKEGEDRQDRVSELCPRYNQGLLRTTRRSTN